MEKIINGGRKHRREEKKKKIFTLIHVRTDDDPYENYGLAVVLRAGQKPLLAHAQSSVNNF